MRAEGRREHLKKRKETGIVAAYLLAVINSLSSLARHRSDHFVRIDSGLVKLPAALSKRDDSVQLPYKHVNKPNKRSEGE